MVVSTINTVHLCLRSVVWLNRKVRAENGAREARKPCSLSGSRWTNRRAVRLGSPGCDGAKLRQTRLINCLRFHVTRPDFLVGRKPLDLALSSRRRSGEQVFRRQVRSGMPALDVQGLMSLRPSRTARLSKLKDLRQMAGMKIASGASRRDETAQDRTRSGSTSANCADAAPMD
jgi:hypothetical protein